MSRMRRQRGFFLVLLGPDGVGKSSVAEGLAASIGPRVRIHHIRPGLARVRRSTQPVTSPHAQPARPLWSSLLQAALWAVDYSVGYWAGVWLDLRRGNFVIFDRYLLDVIVDPARYRYGGPMRIVRLLWSLVPKPDMVLLLDAPAEVVRARKQEVTTVEIERQRGHYLALVSNLPYGRVVDASPALAEVIEAVLKVIPSPPSNDVSET